MHLEIVLEILVLKVKALLEGGARLLFQLLRVPEVVRARRQLRVYVSVFVAHDCFVRAVSGCDFGQQLREFSFSDDHDQFIVVLLEVVPHGRVRQNHLVGANLLVFVLYLIGRVHNVAQLPGLVEHAVGDKEEWQLLLAAVPVSLRVDLGDVRLESFEGFMDIVQGRCQKQRHAINIGGDNGYFYFA